ncbi:CLUMA_CG016622, isoform A [Clunio marinus]|uniref:CLUMA_CG016622, isoform A n=1 Tax=Clunio marinus TaxID=568069 RepID=A0A1J1IWF5_9DIPT|nr:CLUMA_CG016622, isoform A [Clunio marinus]
MTSLSSWMMSYTRQSFKSSNSHDMLMKLYINYDNAEDTKVLNNEKETEMKGRIKQLIEDFIPCCGKNVTEVKKERKRENAYNENPHELARKQFIQIKHLPKLYIRRFGLEAQELENETDDAGSRLTYKRNKINFEASENFHIYSLPQKTAMRNYFFLLQVEEMGKMKTEN